MDGKCRRRRLSGRKREDIIEEKKAKPVEIVSGSGCLMETDSRSPLSFLLKINSMQTNERFSLLPLQSHRLTFDQVAADFVQGVEE